MFPSEKNKELYKTLNIKRKIWAERRGWLLLLDIGHPPPATLIREFYSNLSIHVYDSNTLVKSWIRGVEFTITLDVVVDALGLLVVQNLVYPYDESPPLDDIMSYITGTSIQWGSDPRITSVELTKTTYLFFRIACHFLWPISHLHTIPLERCAFLYALVIDAPISFPHLFLRAVNKVYRSSSIAHALFHPIFIHRILLFLGLDDFPTSKPVYIVAPIGATFLRQNAAHMRESSKRLRVEPSGIAPLSPSPTGTTSGETSIDPVSGAAVAVPPPSTSDN